MMNDVHSDTRWKHYASFHCLSGTVVGFIQQRRVRDSELEPNSCPYAECSGSCVPAQGFRRLTPMPIRGSSEASAEWVTLLLCLLSGHD